MRITQKLIIAIIMIAIITNSIMLTNSTKAVNIIEIPQIELRSKGLCGQLLKYKGVIVKTTFVEYTYDGKSYPAYCLDKTLPGITDELLYSVGTNKKIDDLGLWRTIINGYPYKSLSELGVANEQEAFTATKQAVYCYLFENTPADYEAIDEAGQRTLNALNMIVENAQNSKEKQEDSTVQIKAETEEWTEDEKDSNYISKTYSIASNLSHLDYEIELKGNIPEGSKITKTDGTESMKFLNKEEFKIMLKKDYLNEDGNFTISVKTEVKTKPVIYGSTPNPAWQNYALTGYMYEDAETTYQDEYKKQEKPEEPQKTNIIKEDKPEEKVKILPVTGM